jgi:hypothetical protein
MFQVFQKFQRYVASVLYRCCKSRSGCGICCNGYIHMFLVFYLFQAYVVSVSSECCKSRFGCCIYMQVFQVFSYVCCKCFSSGCCNVFNGYTRVFKFFLVCSKRILQAFKLIQTYVVSVSSKCCKSRSDVAHVEYDPLVARCRCYGTAE